MATEDDEDESEGPTVCSSPTCTPHLLEWGCHLCCPPWDEASIVLYVGGKLGSWVPKCVKRPVGGSAKTAK